MNDGPAPAPVQLFGRTWLPAENPDGYMLAVAHLAAHAIDTDEERAA